MLANRLPRLSATMRRLVLPLLAAVGLMATSACYYSPYGYYSGYPGYGYAPGYAPAPVVGGVVVAPVPYRRYYWR